MDEHAIFIKIENMPSGRMTKSMNSENRETQVESVECEETRLENNKRDDKELTSDWEETCRICANARDHMIPIFQNEGVEHKLSNKIHEYLPIEVSKTDSLPLKLCYHCAATLLAWDELFTGCLEAEKRLLQMQAEIQRKESSRLCPKAILTSSELVEGISIPSEESADDCRSDAAQRLQKPSLPLSSCEVEEKEAGHLKYVDTSIAIEAIEENIMESELVDDPEPIAMQELQIPSVTQEEKNSSLIEEREEQTDEQSEQAKTIVGQCALGREMTERSGRVKKPFNLLIDARSVFRKGRNIKIEVTDSESLSKDLDAETRRTALYPPVEDRSSSPEGPNIESASYPECERIPTEKSEDSPDEESTTDESTNPNENSSSIKVKCTVCSRAFSDTKDLQAHAKAHGDLPESGKIYQCVECDKSFRLKDSFVRHLRIHRDERPFTCHVCGKQFRDSGGLSRHVKDVHAKLKNFPCDICGNSFSSKATRDDHRRTHTGERPYVCETCNKTFKSKACLYSHSKLHTNEFPHPCAYCSKKFRRRQEMLVHATTHTGEKNYSCDVCFMRFRVKTEVARHKLTHSEEKPFVCAKCGLRFRQNRYLNNHVKSRHAQPWKDRSGATRLRRLGAFPGGRSDGSPESGVGKRETRQDDRKTSKFARQFHCEKCRRMFVRESNLKRHVANCCAKPLNDGLIASREETQPEDAQNAIKITENDSEIVVADAAKNNTNSTNEMPKTKRKKKPTSYPCLHCEFSTRTKKSLDRHTLELHPDSNREKRSLDKDLAKRARMEANGRIYYHCDDCGKNLFSTYTFAWHMRIHTGERPFTCHLCGKQFRVNQGLTRHLRETHAGIKRFPCDLCGRMFSTKRNVEDHRRIHTGERPYVCNVCGKAFKQKASLFVHNRTHTDFFPFKCSYCGQEFRTRPPLVIHLTKHTGEKPHTCDICERAFRIKYELKRHRLIHFDEKPWQCSNCGLSFRQKRYLVNHRRINRNCGSANADAGGAGCESRVTKYDLVSGGSRDPEEDAP